MNKSIKVRDLYKERAKYSDIEPVEMVDIDDDVDTWYGISSMVITEKQVEELKNGKAIYFTDGEYGNVIVLDKRLIEQEPGEDAISRHAVLETIDNRIEQLKRDVNEINKSYSHLSFAEGVHDGYCRLKCDLRILPPVTPQPKIGHWNNHQIACMLADLFGDACACNYNGIDEWLSELCDFKDTCCPNPVGVACWEQFLKHRAESEEEK